MGLFYLLIGVALLFLVLAAARWFAAAPARHVAAGLRWLALGGGGLVALWLVLTGRAAQVVYLGLPFLPMLQRWWRRQATAAPPEPGQSSDVETAWLRMRLDHAAGTVDGVVLAGTQRGRRLGELTPDALRALLAELRLADEESASLLESYLDVRDPAWRDFGGTGPAAAGGGVGGVGGEGMAMGRDEAARILGVAADADRDTILAAWRTQMKRNHPDQGGSAYLAAKINQAKETLLG